MMDDKAWRLDRTRSRKRFLDPEPISQDCQPPASESPFAKSIQLSLCETPAPPPHVSKEAPPHVRAHREQTGRTPYLRPRHRGRRRHRRPRRAARPVRVRRGLRLHRRRLELRRRHRSEPRLQGQQVQRRPDLPGLQGHRIPGLRRQELAHRVRPRRLDRHDQAVRLDDPDLGRVRHAAALLRGPQRREQRLPVDQPGRHLGRLHPLHPARQGGPVPQRRARFLHLRAHHHRGLGRVRQVRRPDPLQALLEAAGHRLQLHRLERERRRPVDRPLQPREGVRRPLLPLPAAPPERGRRRPLRDPALRPEPDRGRALRPPGPVRHRPHGRRRALLVPLPGHAHHLLGGLARHLRLRRRGRSRQGRGRRHHRAEHGVPVHRRPRQLGRAVLGFGPLLGRLLLDRRGPSGDIHPDRLQERTRRLHHLGDGHRRMARPP